MDFILAYDYILDPNSFSLIDKSIIPLGAGLLLFYIYKKGIKKYKMFTIITACLAMALGIIVGYVEYNEFQELVAKIEKGETTKLEGKISSFTPIDDNDHGSMEAFEINGVKFFYSDYHKIAGYHHACSNGGILCEEGQTVKLEYYTEGGRNFIVKAFVERQWAEKKSAELKAKENED